LKNVVEVADAGKKQVQKRSLYQINEPSELIFNSAAATQIVFSGLLNGEYIHPKLILGPFFQRFLN
jgi:hypothetical protein